MQITVMRRQFCLLLVATGTLFLPIDRLHKKVHQANLWAHLRKIQVDKNKEDTDINFLDHTATVSSLDVIYCRR